MAEELSATIQEMSSAASQISTAVDQINRGSQQQAAAAQQTSAALAQIEKSARFSQERGRLALARTAAMGKKLAEGRTGVEQMVQAVGETLEKTRSSLETIVSLESIGRKIEKNVDAIALVTIQTTMLAVSGAVEAARAGDAGRGFAVVSRADFSIFGHVAASHQYRYDHRHVFNGLSDPKFPKSGQRGHPGKARRAHSRQYRTQLVRRH
jgi:methyl-accepting chemotaxis protein